MTCSWSLLNNNLLEILHQDAILTLIQFETIVHGHSTNDNSRQIANENDSRRLYNAPVNSDGAFFLNNLHFNESQ